jgi:hypothetical protein
MEPHASGRDQAAPAAADDAQLRHDVLVDEVAKPA